MCERKALEEFDGLARKLAKQHSYLNEFDDMYQVAKIGIIQAIRTYDSSRGTKLSTHVFSVILSHIRSYNAKNNEIIFQPNYFKSKFVREDFESIEYLFTENILEDVELKVLLENAILNLSTKQKELIELKYLQGFSTSEIAKKWDCSYQNVNRLNNEALNKMQKNLMNSIVYF